jgi:hypothetical protein
MRSPRRALAARICCGVGAAASIAASYAVHTLASRRPLRSDQLVELELQRLSTQTCEHPLRVKGRTDCWTAN